MEDPLYEKYESLDLQEAGEVLLSTVSKTSDANAQSKLVDQFREKLESSHLVGIDEDAVGRLLDDRMKPVAKSALTVIFDLVIVKGFAEAFVRQPVTKLQSMRFDKHLKRGDEEQRRAAFELLRLLENRRSNAEIRAVLFHKTDVIDLFLHRTRSELHRSISAGQFEAFEPPPHHLQQGADERAERSPVLRSPHDPLADPRLRIHSPGSVESAPGGGGGGSLRSSGSRNSPLFVGAGGSVPAPATSPYTDAARRCTTLERQAMLTRELQRHGAGSPALIASAKEHSRPTTPVAKQLGLQSTPTGGVPNVATPTAPLSLSPSVTPTLSRESSAEWLSFPAAVAANATTGTQTTPRHSAVAERAKATPPVLMGSPAQNSPTLPASPPNFQVPMTGAAYVYRMAIIDQLRLVADMSLSHRELNALRADLITASAVEHVTEDLETIIQRSIVSLEAVRDGMKARYGSSPLAVAALDKDMAQLRMLASEIAANDLQAQAGQSIRDLIDQQEVRIAYIAQELELKQKRLATPPLSLSELHPLVMCVLSEGQNVPEPLLRRIREEMESDVVNTVMLREALVEAVQVARSVRSGA